MVHGLKFFCRTKWVEESQSVVTVGLINHRGLKLGLILVLYALLRLSISR